MNKLKKEYFEFGPWLSEIRDESDITHQFEHIKEDILNSELAFKVPVDKEFRSVKEGELLYETVIAIDDSGVRCYKVIEDAVFGSHVKFGDIVYVKVAEDILTRDMEIATKTESLHFQYLPTPLELADKFVSMIRNRFEANLAERAVNEY